MLRVFYKNEKCKLPNFGKLEACRKWTFLEFNFIIP